MIPNVIINVFMKLIQLFVFHIENQNEYHTCCIDYRKIVSCALYSPTVATVAVAVDKMVFPQLPQ